MRTDPNEMDLTKREQLAAMAMIGFLSADRFNPVDSEENFQVIAKASVMQADFLIAELNKETSNDPAQKS